MIHSHYRYYKFYANMVVALIWNYLASPLHRGCVMNSTISGLGVHVLVIRHCQRFMGILTSIRWVVKSGPRRRAADFGLALGFRRRRAE